MWSKALNLRWSAILSGLLTMLLCPGFCLSNQAAEAIRIKPSVSHSEADFEKCRNQLSIIHGALLQFQKKKGKLPEWLSELSPEFLFDPKLLVCPFVDSSGKTKEWRQYLNVFRVFGDPKLTSYGYELCNLGVDELVETTVREFKQEQMQVIGGAVPVVRCLAHKFGLNLGMDGSIYRCEGLFWEDLFSKTFEDQDLLHHGLAKGTAQKAVRRLIRERPPNTSRNCLNLTDDYNATLFHLSQVTYEGKLIEYVTNRIYRINDVEYDVRGLVHLGGKNYPIPFPRTVSIKLDGLEHFSRMHFLHGTIGEVAKGSQIAQYVFHFENGKTSTMNISYGNDVQTRLVHTEDMNDSDIKPAWISGARESVATGRSLRLYVKTWQNPEPDMKVERIEFTSELTTSAPFLLGITAQ